MDYSAHTDAALSQIRDLGLVETWQADLSSLGEAYATVDLRMTIDEAGHGVTLMNGTQTADFEAYAAPYTLTVNGDGQTVLTLTADDGTISWVKQPLSP